MFKKRADRSKIHNVTISPSGNGTAQSINAAMLKKVNDHQKLQGEAALQLIESADAPQAKSPDHLGGKIDTLA